jgi:CelD/BcsL family acetyltransferase involved in cellulose biosynthesis
VAYTLLSGSEGLRAIQAAWEQLEERVPVHVFQTYAFGRLWFDTVGSRSGAIPLLVTYEESGNTLGIFPACIVPYGPIKLLTWLSAPMLQDYGDVLWDSSANISPESFVRDALELLLQHSHGAFFYLTNVRDDAVAYPALNASMIPYKRSRAPYVEIPGSFDDYLASLGRGKSAKTLRRKIRNVRAAGSVSLETLDRNSPGIDDALTWIIDRKKARHKGQRGRADLYLPGHEEFRRAQVRDQPGVRVSRLVLDGKTIASDVNCLRNGRLYGMITAFDPGAASFSPGLVLVAYLIKDCSERGIRILDMGWGDEPYKYLWTDLDVGMTTFVRNHARGRLLMRAAGLRRRLATWRGRGIASISLRAPSTSAGSHP